MTNVSGFPDRLAYVGCRTTRERRAAGQGLTTWVLPASDELGGSEQWRRVGLVAAENPSYLHVDGARGVLWTVHGDFDRATTYRLDDPRHPTPAASVPTGGRNPVHLAAPRADLVIVANFATGTVASIAVGSTGLPAGLRAVLPLPGQPGPHPTQQQCSHPHQVLLDHDPELAWVPDKGLDRVFGLDLAGAMPRIVSFVDCPAGSGPRHGVRHPRLPLLYIAEELSSALAVHEVDGPRLRTAYRLSTRGRDLVRDAVAPGAEDSTAAGIVLTPDGSALFVSNRGDDTIACFSLDPAGVPTFVGAEPAGVGCPRFITLSASGAELLVAGETSHTIVQFTIAPTGGLVDARTVARTGSPTCVLFAPTGV